MGRVGLGYWLGITRRGAAAATQAAESARWRAPRRCPRSARGRPPAASRRRRCRAARRAGASPRRPPRPGRRSGATSARVAAVVSRVEPLGGLVDQQHVRRARDRPRQRDATARRRVQPLLDRRAPVVADERRPCRAPAHCRRSAASSPARMRSSVVLPAQRGPSTPCTCPGATTRSTSCKRRPRAVGTRERADLDAGLHSLIICDPLIDVLNEGPGSARVGRMEEAALAALDLDALARDAADLVRVPSVTGDERPLLELVAARADAAGLAAGLHAARPRRAARASRPPGRGGGAHRAVGRDGDAPRQRARAARAQRPRRRRRPGHRAVARATRGPARSRTAACTAAARST